jgi:Asp-tRNA(Asn)/Glu-tRNA(Gln) amidotransferase A subunit family amidase
LKQSSIPVWQQNSATKLFAAEGIPYSIQFTARRLSEGMLCRIAHAYEDATNWHDLHPNL